MLLRTLVVSSLLVLSACRSHVSGTCQKDSDCKEGVCVFNKCQECAVSTDCKDGKTCLNNQCVAGAPKTCTDSSDCGMGMGCQDGLCTANAQSELEANCVSTGTVLFDFN